jgi:branched-chain amino acid transport system substrate-binding protein
MSQKNDTPALLLSLLLTVALIAGGLWWFGSRLGLGNWLRSPGSSSQSGESSSNPQSGNQPGNTASVQDRLSTGTRVLTPGPVPAEKQAGVEAIAAGNYSNATAALEAALKANRNDPETLIYLNNARIGNQTADTIAVSVPMATSGNPALELLRGVAQAQTEINQAGGINGVPLKVMIASDDDNPALCQQIAAALVQDASVLGVIGHFSSSASLAAGQVYQQGKLVMISPTSTSVDLSNLGDYVFRTVPSDRFTATALSRYMLNTLRKQNAAVYYNSASDYSKSLKNEFTTALSSDGGQIVAEFDLASPTFSARSTVDQAAQQGAEVLVLVANTAKLDQALQIIRVNNQKLSLLGGDSIYNPKTLEVGGKDAIGMVVAVPWILLSNPNSAFVKASQQLWGGDVNWRTAMAYDATVTLSTALKQNPTRQGVESALSAPNFSVDGATGTIRFLRSGDRNQAMQLVEVEPGSRSSYGFDFVPAK